MVPYCRFPLPPVSLIRHFCVCLFVLKGLVFKGGSGENQPMGKLLPARVYQPKSPVPSRSNRPRPGGTEEPIIFHRAAKSEPRLL